mgnify:FL=1
MTRTEHAAVTRDRILRARLWLLPCALIWIPMGIGTMNGLAGKPRDAPHLLIPQDLRGWVWIVTGLAALVVLVADRHHSERGTRVAAALLLIMPLVRALSYSLAGVYAITDLDGDGGLDGSPDAYYTCLPWWAISLAILTQAVNWRRIGRCIVARVRGSRE